MIDQFLKLSLSWQILFTLVSVFAFTSILFLFVYIIKNRAIDIILGKNKVSIKSKSNLNDYDLIFERFSFLIVKLLDIYRKIVEIEKHEIIKDQMTYADEKSLEMISLLDQAFRNKLKEKTDIKNIGLSDDAKLFKLILKEIKKTILSELKVTFDDEYFYNYGSEDLNAFIRDRITQILIIVKNNLDLNWSDKFLISREELSEEINKEEYINKIYNIINEIYLKAINSYKFRMGELSELKSEKNSMIDKEHFFKEVLKIGKD